MPIDMPQGDLANAVTHEPNMEYPDVVELRLIWNVDGHQEIRSHEISSAEFFGRGRFGAPLPGEALLSAIERLRRLGAPGPKPRRVKP